MNEFVNDPDEASIKILLSNTIRRVDPFLRARKNREEGRGGGGRGRGWVSMNFKIKKQSLVREIKRRP